MNQDPPWNCPTRPCTHLYPLGWYYRFNPNPKDYGTMDLSLEVIKIELA
jgi:hypothetical protein